MAMSPENIPEPRSREALREAARIISQGPPGAPALERICSWLRRGFSHYSWVGIYLLEGRELFLAAWDGEQATEHTRIPLDRGICGMAARERRTVTVDDVRSSSDYLACFLDTRSEIVVPIREGGEVLGEIDIDGKAVASYDASDRRFLEAIAVQLIPPARAVLAAPPGRGSGGASGSVRGSGT